MVGVKLTTTTLFPFFFAPFQGRRCCGASAPPLCLGDVVRLPAAPGGGPPRLGLVQDLAALRAHLYFSSAALSLLVVSFKELALSLAAGISYLYFYLFKIA